uniref:hypothetical protein n=1 Tax=uncultured Erythrobacter sp. TaxID=263913 RepID=UPI00261DE2BB|nr:hypothetical protein [uncultured Erythrobacter sp.]
MTLWSLSNAAGGTAEPWDSVYFIFFYLFACVVSFGLGFVCRKWAWAIGALVVLTMLPVMYVFAPESAPWLMFGLFFSIILSVPAGVASALGSVLRDKVQKEPS